MRFAVEGWAPEYGAPMDEDGLDQPASPPELHLEVPEGEWAPLTPSPSTAPPGSVLFIDGVRRIEARVWVTGDDGVTEQGICASYASGAVRAEGRRAAVVHAVVERGLFCPAAQAEAIVTRHARFDLRPTRSEGVDALSLGLQSRMGELERVVAAEMDAQRPDELVVVDGPLKQVSGAVGYIKTQHVDYLSDQTRHVIGRIAPGQRSPLLRTTTRGGWSRYSWYQRLPGAVGHPWSGVIRAEISADGPLEHAAARADQVAVTLPRFASQAHKDPRAPQNLHPIAGLERELRRRLGDPALLYRALRVAAATQAEGVLTRPSPLP